MFSPAQGAPPQGSVRSSRRRQRPLSNEGSPPKAKRKRSALSEHTFQPPEAPEMEEAKHSRVVTLSKQRPAPQKEIALREKKLRSTDRGNKGDGSVILTANETYTVSRLPALPDRLRTDVRGRQHGAIYSDSGYALTLTHTHAVVWPYTINVPSPETFDFTLPAPSKHTSDPLPLGSLVSPSASSSDPGLVVIIPTTGQIIYWESISSASTLDLKLQRNGVELSIPGMVLGESVIQLSNAESAGFMLAFSTGRTAYMSVRDGQGRPAISVQFLRGYGGPVGSGIFGSLRNALSASAWRGDIAAVRAARPEKVGERDVVVATSKGKLQSYKIQRGGHVSLTVESDGRELVVSAIKEALPALSDLHLETFELLDFAYTPRSVSGTSLSSQNDNGVHLLLLTSLGSRAVAHYSMVEVVLNANGLTIGNIRPVKSYTTPVNPAATSKTRLYLPNPALVAYIVFDRAVVVISMAKQPDSPETQLRAENRIALQAFEDVVDFRQDMEVEIVGSGLEEPHGQLQGLEEPKAPRYKPKHPAAVVIVRGGGIVRIAATDITKFASTQLGLLTAKSKLEQAVFFGTLDRNPLSFAVRPELQFPPEEIATAAVELSLDILKSRTQYIPAVAASIDQNLRKRSKALFDLIEYLRTSGVELDRLTKWRLLADAEKMTAATLIWNKYDVRIKSKPVGQKRGLLTELVEFIHEDYKTEPVPEAGELDRVRHWFINDIWNLEVAVPWAYQVIKYTYQDGQKDHGTVMEILSEADDLVLGALEGAFDFRTANLKLYGLETEHIEDGVLRSGYEGLPEFWTSSIYITENLRKQAELAGLLVKEYWSKAEADGQPSASVVEKIRREHPALIDIEIRSNKERIRWDLAQDSPQLQIEAEQLRAAQLRSEDDHLSNLANDLGLPDEAIDLAEKHELLSTLASILLSDLKICSSKAQEHNVDPEIGDYARDRLAVLHNRVRRLFTKFGSKWASAFFECQVHNGSLSEMMDDYPEQQPYLSDFLRSKPEYAKVAWIQSVLRENDLNQAGKTLLDLGLNRERDMWSKKIELSMGKLAHLAGRSNNHQHGNTSSDDIAADLVATDHQLALIKIQNQIYQYVLPSINAAIDEKAELQLALEAHGNENLRKQPRFSSFLEESMTQLINHEAMDALALVDLLTLMSDGQIEGEESFSGQRFCLAIKASQKGISSKNERYLVQRVIWRRCMLLDDWKEINNTDLKDDEQVSESLRQTGLFHTIKACLKHRLFGEESNAKPISPNDVLGAATDDLDGRFTGLDASVRESIMKDMQFEDNALKSYIDTCRLGQWYQSALDLAKQEYEKEIAEETEEGKKMVQAEDQVEMVEKEIEKKEQAKADSLLHAKLRYKPRFKLNGSVNFRPSIMETGTW